MDNSFLTEILETNNESIETLFDIQNQLVQLKESIDHYLEQVYFNKHKFNENYQP
jgi:hypothetical protein